MFIYLQGVSEDVDGGNIRSSEDYGQFDHVPDFPQVRYSASLLNY